MMKSSKKGKKPDTKKIGVGTHLATLHQRLYHALNLGFRYSDGKEREWHTNDVEIQRLVVRSISAFLDGITPETLQVPLVKESFPDVSRAIGGILQSQSEAVLMMAAEVAVKLIRVLPSSMLQHNVVHLCHPLSFLLSYHQVQVAVASATGLSLIVSNLSVKKEKEVWKILVKTAAVAQLVINLRNFSDKVKPTEYFLEMASLLSSIMRLWPSSRYPVWTDAKLMEVMEAFCRKSERNIQVAVLEFYSALALCGNGAHKLLDTAEGLVQTSLQFMDESQPNSVRILAFKLMQRLMANKEGCSKVLSLSCEPIVQSIICALSNSSMHQGSIPNHEVSLMLEACRLALITRWPGKHHAYLWKFRVDRVLLDLLIYNFQKMHPYVKSLSVKELISVTREGLNTDFLIDLVPYVWELTGWLSAHYQGDYGPDKHDDDLFMNVLITSSCLAFTDSIGRKRLLRQADRTYTYRSISAAKATMMMIYTPCKYIASQARLILSEILRLDGEEHLKHLIHALNFVYVGNTSRMPDGCQMLISLLGLTCYSGLPPFYRQVVKNGGIKTLLAFVKWWLNNYVHIERLSLGSHFQSTAKDQTCCRNDMQDWEGSEIHLLLALWSLAELIRCHASEGLEVDIFAGQTTYSRDELIKDIQKVFIESNSSLLRWYCSYLLSFFDFYGFPSKLGKRIVSAFGDEDYSDMCLVLRNRQSLNVHRVVLLVRCPSLLPPEDASDKERTFKLNSPSAEQVIDTYQRTKKEVTLSAQVDEEALLKLLDFIYAGYLQAGGDLVRKLKLLAKHCNIQPLLQLLCKERPKWEAPVPSFDLTQALGPTGYDFSDVILEAKSTENAGWTCSWCSLSVPHIHAHRVILCSSCEYMRALFQSGMQESRSQSVKVPVSWEALYKLVFWIYSDNIPKPSAGCLWDNMDVERKIFELRPYIELCWLAEFWFLDDVQDECLKVMTFSLDSPELSIRVIQLAADFSQWKLVDIAAKWIAPAYHNLRRSGTLDSLDEGLVEMIRLASVRLAQE